MLHSPQIFLASRPGIVAAPSGFSLVAHAKSPGTVSNATTTAAIDSTGANLIVLAISQYSGAALGTVSDSKSNTWTALTAKTLNNSYNRLFYCSNPTVGSGHTFTIDNTSGSLFGEIIAQAWSGALGSAPFDVQNGATAAAGFPVTSLQTGSVTPSLSNSLIVASIGPDALTSNYTIDSGFTVSDSVDGVNGTNEGLGMAYLVQGAAAAINPTWSWTTATDSVSATVAVFKP